MSTVRVIADLHLGHKNIALHRGFSTVDEHDKYIISKWNSVVNKRDITYALGDLTMENSKHYNLLSQLNGTIHVIGGNHDRRQDLNELLKYVDSFTGCLVYKGILLTHIPIHPMELEYRVKYNIHGHIHSKHVMKRFTFLNFNLFERVDRRYTCVSCEQIGYTPKSLNELGFNR